MADPKSGGAQTLERALMILDAVSTGAADLTALSARTGLSRSTTQRLAAALTRLQYLRKADGYRLGSKLIELGYRAREQMPLVSLARPILEELAKQTQDTVHLVVPDGDEVLYIDKLPGNRGLELRSRVGSRMPMAITGVGKALMLDFSEDHWQRLHENAHAAAGGSPLSWKDYRDAMRRYVRQKVAFDFAENEFGVRCVAAPIRDAGGQIVAAISVAAADHWMDIPRMENLVPVVRGSAETISHEIGWRPPRTVSGEQQ